LFTNVPDYQTKIRPLNDAPYPVIGDWRGTDPITGTGAANAEKVRFMEESEDGYTESINNADGYACYASLQAWTYLCQKTFDRAESNADYGRRKRLWQLYGPVTQPPPALFVDGGNQTTSSTLPEDEEGCTYYADTRAVVCY
jgi:hypothetical protein